ncbi:MAG: AgmX/PglI C-terminal domain-containing protein [Myxococcota bacterium]|nr:AgmX/PglI C-terminal domain-containing protein [Myxococcota bacterium]
MRDKHSQPKQSAEGKGVILLLIGGVVILAVAGIVIFKRPSSPPPPPPEERPEVAKEASFPAPLVISQPTRPIAIPVVPDAGTAASQEEEKPKKRSARRSEKLGTIDTQEVNRFMNARFAQVKTCYERRLKTNSFLEGKLDLNIQVMSSGKVTGVSVNDDTVRDAEMLACVKQVIRAWQFPKPEGGRVVIAKTFTFKKKA